MTDSVSSEAMIENASANEEPEPTRPRDFRERPLFRIVGGALPFIVILVIWLILSLLNLDALKYAIPHLDVTVKALVTDLSDPRLYGNISITMQEFGLGLLIAIVGGLILGIAVGLSRTIETILFPVIVFFQAIPALALAPLMVIVFGFGIGSKVAVAASVAIFPILIGVMQGMRSIRVDEIDLMRSLSATPRQTFLKVRVQRAIPSAFGGFQVGTLHATTAAVVTEFLGATSGLGYLIQVRSTNLQISEVFSALLILAFIAVVINLLLRFIGRRLSRWEEK
jgi:NitT/TauT family transport system permease protein